MCIRDRVGEYGADRANSELAACDVDIGRLEGERTGAATELHRIQEILALVRQAPSRPGGAPPPQSEPDSTMEELAFLNSVVDRPSRPSPVASPSAAPTPSMD